MPISLGAEDSQAPRWPTDGSVEMSPLSETRLESIIRNEIGQRNSRILLFVKENHLSVPLRSYRSPRGR